VSTNQSKSTTIKPIYLYNTASRSVEEFRPITSGLVGLYTCGPTVYDYAHIGNLRTYIFEDILKRTLLYNGYSVKHVMNVTDVGHLTSDADEGEDKMEKGARRTGQTVWDIAQFFQQQFFSDLQELDILPPDIIAKATDEIPAQQQLIQILINKGYAYQTQEAIYFDITKFPQYGDFARQKVQDKQTAVRSEIHEDPDKRHPADFALWLFTVGEHALHVMRWPSPWGEGFPGWHIECSAISMKYLGEEFDIHTGGVDHIGTHHPNEIAQSEAATGKKFAHYWLHGEFLNISGDKMSKSKENFDRLQTIKDHGFAPLDYRYFCLTAHYRTRLEFSWEGMQQAAITLKNLKREVVSWDEATEVDIDFEHRFHQAINNDLDAPTALSVVWEMVGAAVDSGSKRATMNKFEQVLGLGLHNYQSEPLSLQEEQLIANREQARKLKDWATSDKLRDQLAKRGVEINDTPDGPTWIKLP
jgi:cysteinyl-tRNA synthetase